MPAGQFPGTRLAQQRDGGDPRHADGAALQVAERPLGAREQSVAQRSAEGVDGTFEALQGVDAHERGQGTLTRLVAQIALLDARNAGAEPVGGIVGGIREREKRLAQALDIAQGAIGIERGRRVGIVGGQMHGENPDFAGGVVVEARDAGTAAGNREACEEGEVGIGEQRGEGVGGEGGRRVGVFAPISVEQALGGLDDACDVGPEPCRARRGVERAMLRGLDRVHAINECELVGQIAQAVADGRGGE